MTNEPKKPGKCEPCLECGDPYCPKQRAKRKRRPDPFQRDAAPAAEVPRLVTRSGGSAIC